MSDETKTPRSRGRIPALVTAGVALVGAAVVITVQVEHALHGHDGHAEKAGGHQEKAGAHGEEKHDDNRVTLTPAARENAKLELLTAGPGKVTVTIALPGEVALNAEALAHVTPRVGGTTREVLKQLGDVVKKGDVLAVLDSRELTEMQRSSAAAEERLKLAQASYDRQEQLWRDKISAEKEYLAAKQALAEARIEQRSAAQKLSSAGSGVKGAGYSLIAPIDGTIIAKHLGIGEVLKDDTQAFTIADLSTIWVNVTVYAKDLARVRTGAVARVRAEGIEGVAEGTISYLGQVADEQTRSSTARVVLRNPGPAWRPGLFATADIVVDETDAPITVSDEAVQTVEGKPVVFRQDGDTFQARPVKLGRRGAAAPGAARLVEILDGIAAGDRYAGKNSFVLKAELGKSEAGHEH